MVLILTLGERLPKHVEYKIVNNSKIEKLRTYLNKFFQVLKLLFFRGSIFSSL